MVLLVCFGGFGLWSALAPLESAAVASGQVRVESKRKTVQHLEGGIVSEILVSDGDRVSKGQILLKLDQTQAEAELGQVRWQHFTALAKVARLKAERDGSDHPAFPEPLQGDDVSPEVADLRQGEERLFQFRRESLDSEIAVLEQRIGQLNAQIDGLHEIIRAKEERIKLFSEEISEWESLFERKLSDKQRLRTSKHQKLELEAEVAEHKSDAARLKIQIGETKSQIIGRKQQFMTDVISDLSQAESVVADTEIRMTTLQARLTRTDLRSPDDGIVMGLQVHTVGAVISPGSPLMYVVPQTKDFVVEAQIPITEIDRIHVGQDAHIRFSAFDTRATHVIPGKVSQISADRFDEERTGRSYYKAEVDVTKAGLDQMGEDKIQLLPGMPAEVMIKTGSRTLLDYLVRPFSNMLARSFREK